MARGLKDDLPDGESELFFREGLDRGFAKLPDGQISGAHGSPARAPPVFTNANHLKKYGPPLFRFVRF